MELTESLELRKAFPKDTVGILPKPYKKDSPKGKCDVCGGYHGLPAVHLDYVGHAAVTDRLLSVDPSWSWEPMAFDQQGSPALDREGNLWIRLTVLGVTRIGCGDGPSMKERIGDALRNAAMRFGVALSLWSKDELESGYVEDKATEHVEQNQSGSGPIVQSRRVQHSTVRPAPETGEKASPKQVQLLKKLSAEKGVPVDEPERLTKGAASKVIESLMAMQSHVAQSDPVAEAFPGSTYEPDEEPF